jgi:hypothetical protein
MIDPFNDPGVRVFISSLNTDINWATISTWLVIAVILSMIGGALGVMMIAGNAFSAERFPDEMISGGNNNSPR